MSSFSEDGRADGADEWRARWGALRPSWRPTQLRQARGSNQVWATFFLQNAGVQTSAAPGAATDSATGDAAVHDSAPASAEAADDVAADAEKEEQGATAASASGVPPGV